MDVVRSCDCSACVQFVCRCCGLNWRRNYDGCQSVCEVCLESETQREREHDRGRERESRLDEGVLDETTEVELLAASA